MSQSPEHYYMHSQNYGTQGQDAFAYEQQFMGRSSYEHVPSNSKGVRASSVRKGAAYVAEFIGTFVLVFAVGSCFLVGNGKWGPVAIGALLTALIYSLGALSGGHFNPAVSITMASIGALKWTLAIGYIIMQLLGGILAGICVRHLLGNYELNMPFQPSPNSIPGAPPIAPNFPMALCSSAEFLYTTMLCFVVANVAASKRNNKKDDPNQFYGMAIGAVIVAGGYAVGGVSGAMFNPSVAFGLNVLQMKGTWGLELALDQILASVVAAILYFLTRPEDFRPDAIPSFFEPRLSIKCLGEFIGTFFLMLTVGLNIVMGSPAVAFSAASALMSMIYSLGDVSGAQFNPAVTLAVALRGKCPPPVAFFYMVAQLAGSSCAAAVYSYFHSVGPNSTFTFGLGPGADFSLLQAGIAEMFATCVLCFTVLSVATTSIPASFKTQQRFYFALAISSCVTAGGFVLGGVSGGSLNPAVSAGITFANAMHHGYSEPPPLMNLLVYSAWELLGGVIAAFLFYVVHPEEFHHKSIQQEIIL